MIVGQTAYKIERVERNAKGGASVTLTLLDEKGGDNGKYTMSWRTEAELDYFLAQTTLQEVVRNALASAYTPETKEIDAAALEQKTFDAKPVLKEATAIDAGVKG